MRIVPVNEYRVEVTLSPEELDGYFPELRDLVKDCYYSDCTHDETEVGCAVHKAVAEGRVSRARYESYLRMRFGSEEELNENEK